jgi:hypothetical protein
VQDVAGQPQQMTDGRLRTPGVVDFFRMLNEQVGTFCAIIFLCVTCVVHAI